MTQYFVSIESNKSLITNQILPTSQRYGIESLIAISENFSSDIEGINLIGLITKDLKGLNADNKFNKKFYPHLAMEHTFGIDSGEADTKAQYVENTYIVNRINVLDDDGANLAQFAVCIKPSQNDDEMLMQTDSHFSKEAVPISKNLN